MKLKFALAILLAAAAGWCAATFTLRGRKMAEQNHSPANRCPMHPWVKSEKPAVCPICGMKLVPSSSPVSTGGNPFGNSAVMLPPGAPGVLGVRAETVKKRPLIRTIRVAGMIGEDESQHGVISAPVAGRIDGLAMNCEGEQTHLLQPIASMYSETLLAAAEDYKRALKTGGAGLETARLRLEKYGLVSQQIASIPTRQPDDFRFGILSRISGTVVKSYVSEGQYVAQGEKLFETADFSRMWFMFPVYEQDLPFIGKGQFVRIKTASLPGETLRAKINFISPNLDGMSRAASVRVVLENKDRRIKNNIYAEGVIETESPEVLAVPRSAVLWPGSQPRVYVEKTSGNYEPRPVRLGRAGDENWEVLEGLAEGERVVVSGNMLMDSQAQLDEITATPMPQQSMPGMVQSAPPNFTSPAGAVK